MAFLTAISGASFGKRFEVENPLTVLGRHPDCDVTIEVGAVSRQHAQIHKADDRFDLEDLKSRNGTFLNGRLITDLAPLNDGDLIRICDVEYSFHIDREQGTSLISGGTANTDGSSFGVVLIDDESSGKAPVAIKSKLDVRNSAHGSQLTSNAEARLQAVLEIAQNLGRAVKLEEVLPKVLDTLFKIFLQADRAFIVLREGEELIPRWIKTRQSEQEETFRISRTVLREVMDSKQAIISLDATSDERFEMAHSISDFRIRSMIVAPLLDADGQALGAIQMDTLDAKRHFEEDDLQILAGIATQAGIAIENAQLHEALVQQERVEQDMELARNVQQAFLPAHAPQTDGYEFFQYYLPADSIGGDYYDYIHLAGGRLAVVVADVVGHGVAAAMLMAKLSAETRFLLASQDDPAEAITQLNTRISNLGVEKFVTFLCLVLEPESGQVAIVNAGHMAPLWIKPDGSIEEPGDETAGIPLGIIDDYQYDSTTMQLGPTSKLILYPDGINEAPNTDGTMFGIERLKKLVSDTQCELPALGQNVVRNVQQYVDGTQQADDMCLVMLARR